jgi:hypothetical protein
MQDKKTYSSRWSDTLRAVRMLADELTPRIARGRSSSPLLRHNVAFW